jgi:hypothetical protein
MSVTTVQRTSRSTGGTGWAPFALVALVLLPLFFGVLRLVELAGGPALMPANPRLNASPGPVVVHIVSAAGPIPRVNNWVAAPRARAYARVIQAW